MGFSFQGLRRGAPGALATDAVYRQWLKLPFRGAIIDPRIVGFDLSINPGFTQRTSPGLPEALHSEELNFGYAIRVLPTKPLSFTYSSSKASGNTSGGFGARGDFETESVNGVLRFTNRLLPMELRYGRLSRVNSWVSGLDLPPIQWSNESRSVRFSATNRKLDVRLHDLEFLDRLGSASFTTFDAGVNHRLRWGKGSLLHSSWDSNERAGSLQSTRSTWRERLHIQHTEGTSSDFSYSETKLTTAVGDRRSRSVSGTLRGRPAGWLTLGASASGRKTRFNGSSDAAFGGGPDAAMLFRLPGRGRINLSAALGRERRTRVNVGGGVLDVLDETHVVDETRSFLLDHPHVEIATIVIRDEDTDVFYTPEIEYRIVPVGDLIEIILLPGTRIEPGTPLLVSYRYRIPELPSGDVTTGRYNASFSMRGVTLQHTRSLRDSDRGNGEALLGFSTFDEVRSSVRVNWNTPLGRYDFEGSIRERRSSAFDFETAEVSSSLALPRWRQLQVIVGGSGRRTTDGAGELTARSAYGTVLWAPHPRLQLSSRVQLLALELDGGSGDRTVGGYVNASFGLGQIEGSVRFEYDRRFEPLDYSGGRLYVRLARQL